MGIYIYLVLSKLQQHSIMCNAHNQQHIHRVAGWASLCEDAVQHRWLLTLIGGEFTVSGFDRSQEVSSNYHRGEADITAVFPHQGPECKPTGGKKYINGH